LDPCATILGIDVGEDFLDLVSVECDCRKVALARVDLRKIIGGLKAVNGGPDSSALAQLAGALTAAIPPVSAPTIALVDSPRWPCDLDWSRPGMVRRSGHQSGRDIDRALRGLVSRLRRERAGNQLAPLSMFPTPRFDYFGARLASESCKPHLRAFGHELFGDALKENFGKLTGGTFTRFMIAGFATYRALGALGVESYESYPDLQFRLWSAETELPSKASKPSALRARQRVLAQLMARLELDGASGFPTLDAADAAILALSVAAAAREGAIVALDASAEGRFIVALGAADAKRTVLAEAS
jgi:hypothetical protein